MSKFIQKNFGLLLLVSAVLSYFVPAVFLLVKNYTDELLMLTLFIGFLKIDFSELFHLKNNIGKMLGFVVLSMVILPVAFYLVSFGLTQDLRISIFLLLVTSGAVATPLFASFLKLKILWATVFVVLTSLLIPFTAPLLTQLLFGVSLEISVVTMMIFLAKIIFIPAGLAIVARNIFPRFVKASLPISGSIGTLSIIIFIGCVVAINRSFLAAHLLQLSTLEVLVLLSGLFATLFLLGFFLPHATPQERWPNSLMFGNMNNGLMVLLAQKFFSEQIVFIVLVSELPWVLSQFIMQKIIQKYYNDNS